MIRRTFRGMHLLACLMRDALAALGNENAFKRAGELVKARTFSREETGGNE